MKQFEETIKVTSSAFAGGQKIPERYTGNGEDLSPMLQLSALSPQAKSIAVVMEDLGHPIKGFTHWVIWNIPPMTEIPEGVAHGARPTSPQGAVQGVAYGKHRYRGPKPPFGMTHDYQYSVFVLDTMLDISEKSKKKDLLAAMEGHISQYGSITGEYK